MLKTFILLYTIKHLKVFYNSKLTERTIILYIKKQKFVYLYKNSYKNKKYITKKKKSL